MKDSINSLAPLPGLYAAWLTLIASLVLSNILCTTATARIFLKIDGRIIGRRLLHRPCGFLGLGRGIRWPNLISFGYSPVSAATLRISDISVKTSSGPSFISSAGILSGPVLLLFLSLLAHICISSGVKGLSSATGWISLKGATFSKENNDSKKEVIISVFSSGSLTTSCLLFVTTTFICSFLFRVLIAS